MLNVDVFIFVITEKAMELKNGRENLKSLFLNRNLTRFLKRKTIFLASQGHTQKVFFEESKIFLEK